MERQNDLEEYQSHANLKGAVFRRKLFTVNRFTGLFSFGAAGAMYSNYAALAGVIGNFGSTAAITATAIYGMLSFYQRDVINSISVTNEGQIAINIGSSLISSRNIVADPQNVQGIFSLSNDDMGENDVENNVVRVTNYTENGQVVPEG